MRYATLRVDGDGNVYPYGFYELNPFPGCNQLVVSNHAFVNPKDRGQGFGKRQHTERLRMIEYLGYDAAIATVKEGNEREEAILAKNQWTKVYSFRNRETGNRVGVWMREFNE